MLHSCDCPHGSALMSLPPCLDLCPHVSVSSGCGRRRPRLRGQRCRHRRWVGRGGSRCVPRPADCPLCLAQPRSQRADHMVLTPPVPCNLVSAVGRAVRFGRAHRERRGRDRRVLRHRAGADTGGVRPVAGLLRPGLYGGVAAVLATVLHGALCRPADQRAQAARAHKSGRRYSLPMHRQAVHHSRT